LNLQSQDAHCGVAIDPYRVAGLTFDAKHRRHSEQDDDREAREPSTATNPRGSA
jgi:hypothetical protein